ncbi:MAG: hypothetical protein WAN47_10555 [Nitrosotalea sp.]
MKILLTSILLGVVSQTSSKGRHGYGTQYKLVVSPRCRTYHIKRVVGWYCQNKDRA